MEWRLGLATAFFFLLIGIVLYIAVTVTPAVRSEDEDAGVPKGLEAPEYGRLPEAQWGKYVRLYNGEERVVAPLPWTKKLFMDSSGNLIFPDL
jgi:hypothetical protein